VKLNHLFKVQIGYVGGTIGLVAWNEVPRKAVNHYKDEVLVPLGLWQTKDEIHANIFIQEA